MKKIIANIGWIFFDKIFRMAAGVLVGIWVARYLGPANFGVLNYAILFPTIFTSIAGFGLNNVLMVEYVAAGNDSYKKHQLLSTSLAIKIAIGLLSYCLTIALNYFFNFSNQLLFILINISGIALLLQSVDAIDVFFQSQTKAKLPVIVKLITFTIAILFRIYGVIHDQGLVFFVIVNIIETIIAYCLMLLVYKHFSTYSTRSILSAVDSKLANKLMIIGWPIMFTEFFVYVYMKIDQFMIEQLSTNKELGLYGATLRLSESWYFIAIAICSSLYPKIAELWIVDKNKFYERYQQMLNILTYISIILSILCSLFADQLIELLYGMNYNGAGNILRIHIWAGIFVFIGVGINNLMIIKNLQKFVLIKTVIAAILNIVLNYQLIPTYGAVGASLSTLISYSLSAYGLNFFYTPSRLIFHLQTKSFINFLTLKNPIKNQKKFNLNEQIT